MFHFLTSKMFKSTDFCRNFTFFGITWYLSRWEGWRVLGQSSLLELRHGECLHWARPQIPELPAQPHDLFPYWRQIWSRVLAASWFWHCPSFSGARWLFSRKLFSQNGERWRVLVKITKNDQNDNFLFMPFHILSSRFFKNEKHYLAKFTSTGLLG